MVYNEQSLVVSALNQITFQAIPLLQAIVQSGHKITKGLLKSPSFGVRWS